MSGQLKEVRDRIKSVKSTQQITKAMKMVSAAKLRRAQDAIVRMRPYANQLDHILRNIISNLDGDPVTSFSVKREVQSAIVVVVTSSRGLCGAFNSSINKLAAQKIKKDYAEFRKNGKLSMLFIGKKGYDFFKRSHADCNLNTEYLNLFSDLTFDNVAEVSNKLMDMFSTAEVDEVSVVYGRFKNAALQFPELHQFLPVQEIEVEDADASKHRADYIFEPSKQELLENLIPSILQTNFQKFLLDTHASEHGARMTAMDNATENAEEMLKDLKINYNKARQEAITRELSEIVGGAAALEG